MVMNLLISKFYSLRAWKWVNTRNKKADWWKKISPIPGENVQQLQCQWLMMSWDHYRNMFPKYGYLLCAGGWLAPASACPTPGTWGFTTKILSLFSPNPVPTSMSSSSLSQFIWRLWLAPSTELTKMLVYCRLGDWVTGGNSRWFGEEDACWGMPPSR